MDRLIKALWRRGSNFYKFFLLFSKCIKIGDNPVFVGAPWIKNNGTLTIGHNAVIVSIGSGNPLWCFRPCTFHVEAGGRIEVGNDFSASGCCLQAKTSIAIGNNVSLGANVTILDNDMHSLENPCARGGIKESLSSAVVVEDDVWLGAGVTVLKGVRIGAGSVIGAGVVLRKSVPPGAIVTSAPNVVKAKHSLQQKREL
ncbi:acyltransferase [Oleiharenicola lentus]|uniref:acyltransferase n=1 Tax=Oleiharenicola lentus TaxID=2508720 RepID=UPI003F67935F